MKNGQLILIFYQCRTKKTILLYKRPHKKVIFMSLGSYKELVNVKRSNGLVSHTNLVPNLFDLMSESEPVNDFV